MRTECSAPVHYLLRSTGPQLTEQPRAATQQQQYASSSFLPFPAVPANEYSNGGECTCQRVQSPPRLQNPAFLAGYKDTPTGHNGIWVILHAHIPPSHPR